MCVVDVRVFLVSFVDVRVCCCWCRVLVCVSCADVVCCWCRVLFVWCVDVRVLLVSCVDVVSC